VVWDIKRRNKEVRVLKVLEIPAKPSANDVIAAYILWKNERVATFELGTDIAIKDDETKVAKNVDSILKEYAATIEYKVISQRMDFVRELIDAYIVQSPNLQKTLEIVFRMLDTYVSGVELIKNAREELEEHGGVIEARDGDGKYKIAYLDVPPSPVLRAYLEAKGVDYWVQQQGYNMGVYRVNEELPRLVGFTKVLKEVVGDEIIEWFETPSYVVRGSKKRPALTKSVATVRQIAEKLKEFLETDEFGNPITETTTISEDKEKEDESNVFA